MAKAGDTPQTEQHGEFLPEAEPMAVQDIRDALVIRERDMFLLTDTSGQVQRGNINGYGLYYRDTRYLSGYELRFSTTRPLVLLSTAEIGYSCEQVMTNPTMIDADGRRVERGTLHLRRTRVIEDVLEETLTIRNHNPTPVCVELQYRFAADFADIFEVRGHEPERKGQHEAPGFQEGALTMRYLGADGRRRETMVYFDPAPDSLAGDADVAVATYRVTLKSQESFTLRLVTCLDGRLELPHGAERFAVVAGEYGEWRADTTRIEADNKFFNAILQRSFDDLRMLWTPDAGTCYPAAGTPWYDTLFGRDACIAGLQTLAFKPDIARHSLAALARFQGKKFDTWRDEAPGKILHEIRRGELTETGELPFSPYFGSIDATPLFLILAGEYLRWTGDVDFIRGLRPNLDAALHWVSKHADEDGDGYLEYEKRSPKGLINQCWKDSADSMVHRDGSLASPPIAPVEVQSYVYAALRLLADAFQLLGDAEEAPRMRQAAAALREGVNSGFWLEEDGCYALALDGAKRPAASITSNAGHALWCGIAAPEQARRVADRLMRRDMFSGWGVRTLSSDSPRYNPQGYHLGTIWPHDNSLVAMGFKRYGFEPELNVIASALYRAACMFQYYRLPELFGGSEPSGHETPVPYPVACKPQAWAAGAFPLITQAILGLCPDAPNGRLFIVNPLLPDFVSRVKVTGLRCGTGEADILYQRRGSGTWAVVQDVRGELAVEIVREWPAM